MDLLALGDEVKKVYKKKSFGFEGKEILFIRGDFNFDFESFVTI